MMSRHIRQLSWLLLALLALRGLVPAGYMVDATADGLSIVVCDSGIYAAAAQLSSGQTAHRHHHHDGNGEGKESSGISDHSICPFAIAATGASAPSLPLLETVTSVVVDRVASNQAVVTSLSGPSRAQQSRAPPYFS
jgi:hypothetical protein